MKKIILLTIVILIFSTTIVAQDYGIKEDEIDIETSIVLLNLYKNDEVVKSDYFFEILNFEDKDYYLIPVNLLSKNIDLTIIYDRLNNLLEVRNKENNKTVKIDITNKSYVNFEKWNSEPPIILNNDFFISGKVVSYLLDVEIEWNKRNQELLLKGDFDSQFEKDNQIEKKDKNKLIEKRKEEIISADSGFNIGSINYKVILDYKNNQYYNDSLNLKEVISIFSRYNKWAITIKEEGRYNTNNELVDIKLPLLRAEYRDEKKLIILGDTSFKFKNTLGEKNIRGLYIRTPEKLSMKVIPLINIEGEVTPNSEVELYVNNELVDKVSIEENNKYNFENVALKFNVLNRIKIIITDPNGKKEIIDKKITAVEKILNEGTKELEIVGGYYNNNNNSTNKEYEDLLAGFRGGIALNEDLSLNAEASYYNKEETEEIYEYITSNVGLAYRLFDNTIVSLDWYYGDYNGENLNGYKLNLHYAFNRGYFDGYYFHIPNYLDELIPESQGKEQRITGIISLNQDWSIMPTIGIYESLDFENPKESKYIRLSLRNKSNWGNYIALTGSYENIIKNYYQNIEDQIFVSKGENNRYGLGAEIKRYIGDLRVSGEGNIYLNNINIQNDNNYSYNEINYSIDFYKKLMDKILLTGDYEDDFEDYDGNIFDRNREIKLRMKYNIFDNSYLSFAGKYIDLQDENSSEQRYSLSYNGNINKNLRIYGQYSSIFSTGFSNYNELSVNAIYNLKNNQNYINLFTNYTIPRNDSFNNKWEYGISYNYITDSLDQFILEIGKNYLTQFNENYEYYLTVSFAQAYSFAKDKVLKSNYNSSSHRSFIAGYVYLDENNNGRYDKNEERLPDIELSLDNMITKSNEEGLYRFNPMLSDTYILDFNYRSLSADYTPITKEKLVKVRENENIFINFGLTLNGSISGKIFLDKNNNGVQESGEQDLSWIGVTLDENKYDYTDNRGEFYFENVPLGSHKLNIVKESMPDNLIFKNNFPKVVVIKKDEIDVKNILIPLHYQF